MEIIKGHHCSILMCMWLFVWASLVTLKNALRRVGASVALRQTHRMQNASAQSLCLQALRENGPPLPPPPPPKFQPLVIVLELLIGKEVIFVSTETHEQTMAH